MQKILILFAHPALHKSRVNRQLVRKLPELDGITFHPLYEAYPDFHIDVSHEQNLLVEHDLIIFHHPFYWYSTPSILKEWQDLVLEHGWAYGSEGTALRGKTLMSVMTTGGPQMAYQEGGYNKHTIQQLITPIALTGRLCGMSILPPFVVHGTHLLEESDIVRHAENYEKVLVALRDGRIDRDKIRDWPRINEDMESLLAGTELRDEW